MGMGMRMVILNVINLSYCFIFFNLNRSLTKDLINSLSMKSVYTCDPSESVYSDTDILCCGSKRLKIKCPKVQ